jgi:hypothetical protein
MAFFYILFKVGLISKTLPRGNTSQWCFRVKLTESSCMHHRGKRGQKLVKFMQFWRKDYSLGLFVVMICSVTYKRSYLRWSCYWVSGFLALLHMLSDNKYGSQHLNGCLCSVMFSFCIRRQPIYDLKIFTTIYAKSFPVSVFSRLSEHSTDF